MRKYNADLKSLELVRFALAITILIWHFQNFFFPIPSEQWAAIRESQPFYSILKPCYDNGLIAVQIFWYISGIIFFKIYAIDILERKVGWRLFVISRFSLLYPLHLLTLLIVTVLQVIYCNKTGVYFIFSISKIDFFKNLLFVQRWSNGEFTFNAPSWSISVEILIYCLFFFFASIGFFKKIKTTLLVFLFAIILKRLNLVFTADILTCLYFFIAGCLSMQLFDVISSAFKKAFFIVLIVLSYIALEKTGFLDANLFWNLSLRTLFLSFVVTFPIVFLFKYVPLFDKIPVNYFTSIGNLTYTVYLIHFPIQLLVVAVFPKIEYKVILSNWFFFSYFTAVIFISYLVYNYFENRVKLLLRNLLG